MMPDFLQEDGIRLLLFGGKGGVGKTTCAFAAALYLAHKHPRRSFLLVSTDPAHSLIDCLAGTPLPENVTLREIDAQDCLKRFKVQHDMHLRMIALRGTFLDQTDVEQLMDMSIPGLDEVMALLEILDWVKTQKYACIIVDTAPAGHTLRLLGLPTLMGRWVEALDAMLAKHRYLMQLYQGVYHEDEVDIYLQQNLSNLTNLWKLLRSPHQCRFVPVMLAEALSIHITRVMLGELTRLGLSVQEVVVNRLLTGQPGCSVCAQWALRQVTALRAISQAFPAYLFWGIPQFVDEVRGVEHLLALWEQAQPLEKSQWGSGSAIGGDEQKFPHAWQTPVSNPAPLPVSTTKLLLFAGKGGVGKTTLACASALHLAQVWHPKEILLFSIDPAHSLGACLGREIGAQETRVAPGLSVIELNAQAEYEGLKLDYAAELRRVWDRPTGQSGYDLTFDREVMERMLDVAPPGLDEMLALTRVVDLMARNQYDLFVLDTAPTGHLIRFLEMPELIEKWLKTFFGLFLKYRNIFWLPKITQMMVDLSKKMKVFRQMLSDAQKAGLMVVTIPTEMAYEETVDLLAACERLRVAVPLLFVNMVTPSSSCPICSRMRQMQTPVLERYQSQSVEQHVVTVFRQEEPHGLERLRTLGRALYAVSDSTKAQQT